MKHIKSEYHNIPVIDAVITWVDGHDPAHQTKLSKYLSTFGAPPYPEAAASTRFNQCNEIDYCVQSILRFAPWIRSIFIVTDNQTPPIMNILKGTISGEKLKLVDHSDIFFNHKTALPTFNSVSIEALLWRIEGLSDNFIYFNDDCFLVRPVKPEDFFKQNKRVIRGQWKTPSAKTLINRCKAFLGYPIASNEHRELQQRTAVLAGWENKFFHLPHVPFALSKTTFEQYFKNHPEHLSQNVHYPIRNPNQFWPISLAQHLDIRNHHAIIDKKNLSVTINAACHTLEKIQQRLNRVDKSNAAFLCVQSLDMAPETVHRWIINWLDRKIIL